MENCVAIIGAGVSGLTCGVVLAERGNRVVLLADETGQATTSAVAGAIWYPYDAEPADLVVAWALETYRVLVDLSEETKTGVSMIELRNYSRGADIQIPDWGLALGARLIALSGEVAVFQSGFRLTVPLTDTTIYLDYLRSRFIDAGGTLKAGVHFDRLDDVDRDFELIVNCAGIGARNLVPDRGVEPHRGQVAIVPKFSLPYAVVCDDPPLMYAIPRANDCLFGGTNDLSDDRDADSADGTRIVEECARVLKIDKPKVLAERVGLRPFRSSGVRVEADGLADGRAVIHNYGHGGAGFTLSWGCANKVSQLARS
jgi:D-amino-acid oxidase